MTNIIMVENSGTVEVEIEVRDGVIAGIRRNGASDASARICKVAQYRVPNERDFANIERDFAGVRCFNFEVSKRERTPIFAGAIV